MTYLGVAATVLGTGLVAGFLAWAMRRVVRFEALRHHHEVGSAVFLQLGVIYAVLLAFVFNEVWSEYNTAANAIDQECGSLHGASILASALPAETGTPIELAIHKYLSTVIESEWPAMQRRQASPPARLAFETMWQGIANRDAGKGMDDPTRSQLMAQLSSAHQWRETRLFQMTLHVPGLMWVLLIGLGVVLIGFLLCFGIVYVGSQVMFTAIFAASIALVLAVVHCLDFPFEGSLRLPPTDFQATLQKVVADQGGPRASSGQ
jgi:hypothetical protein